jgi:oxygen-independent coproporphyrinogen-3 oxidase
VAKVEREKVNLDNKLISIYIGMPFCPTRCLYCSFTSNPIAACSKLVPEYLSALMLEINKVAHYISEKGLKIQCVYFGGGTPTSVSDQQFKVIMGHIYNSFIKNNNVEEFTVECGRPDSITEDKLITMKKYNVHRISINPQSMNDNTLKLIGRNHTVKDTIDKFNMARKMQFDNINMDIIVGLPGEGIEEVEKTCDSIFELNPDNITIHGLSIKRASRLYEDIINKKNYSIASHENLIKMYNRTALLAQDLKMNPYYMYRQKNMVGNMENIGYCKEGKEGIYNIQMIEDKQTIIACGADAVTKAVYPSNNKIERTTNVKDLREYIGRIEEMINKKIQLLNNIY